MTARQLALAGCALVATITACVVVAICADELATSIDQARDYPATGPRSIP